MRPTPTVATCLAVLSFLSVSTATDQPSHNVIRVSLERKSFMSSPDHNSRGLVTRADNAAGYVNKDFLKTHLAGVAM